MHAPIDLRSDTVTRPTAEMREVMARAEVGDDVYGEDPSVNRLQELAAERLGMEAGLFVPSGTMANQIAIRTQTQPGDALVVGWGAHIFLYEGGGAAALSGVQSVVVGDDGLFGPEELRAAVDPDDEHFARTRLVCLENTHNRSGGRVYPLERQRAVAEAARELGLALHLDGARIFNAAAATGTPVSTLASLYDSVAFCLSKGLGAPVGSLLCGSRDFIQRAHRVRKLFGGGMRQAGILAAAGSFALEHHTARLAEDHALARRLAEGIRGLKGIALACEPETNMVLMKVEDAQYWLEGLRDQGILIGDMGPGTLRAVTHLDVDAPAVDRAIAAFSSVAG